MRVFGFITIAIGLIFSVFALFMDVSVLTSSGERVNNIGLISAKQNYMIFGGFVAIAGIIMSVFGGTASASSLSVKCPYCAEKISSEAVKCKHCGSDVVPSIQVDDVQSTETEDRLEGVNVKFILLGVFSVFAVIIATIFLYRN